MVVRSKINIENHLIMDEINKLISDLKIEINSYKQLLFLKLVKKGMPMKHVAELVGVNSGIGICWIKQYNEKGLEGLIPNFSGGRPSFLSDNQLKDLKKRLSDPEKNYSIKEVQTIIKDKYKAEYSYKQV